MWGGAAKVVQSLSCCPTIYNTQIQAEAYLAVMAGISGANHAVAVSMVRVSFHLRIHSVVVMLLLLLLRLLHLWLMIGIESVVVTRYDADLLTVFEGTS